MNYSYLTSGDIFTIYSCSKYYFKTLVITNYKIGDILYLKKQALKGKLEKIVIKKVQKSYKDTLNAFHNESDLITYQEALILIEKFKIEYASKLEKNNC